MTVTLLLAMMVRREQEVAGISCCLLTCQRHTRPTPRCERPKYARQKRPGTRASRSGATHTSDARQSRTERSDGNEGPRGQKERKARREKHTRSRGNFKKKHTCLLTHFDLTRSAVAGIDDSSQTWEKSTNPGSHSAQTEPLSICSSLKRPLRKAAQNGVKPTTNAHVGAKLDLTVQP